MPSDYFPQFINAIDARRGIISISPFLRRFSREFFSGVFDLNETSIHEVILLPSERHFKQFLLSSPPLLVCMGVYLYPGEKAFYVWTGRKVFGFWFFLSVMQ